MERSIRRFIKSAQANDLSQQTVSLTTPQTSTEANRFDLSETPTELEAWFSEYFNQRVTLKENKESGFPDDLEAAGPTIISTQTYEELSRWFPKISVEELRLRFRANLEIAGDAPFVKTVSTQQQNHQFYFRSGR